MGMESEEAKKISLIEVTKVADNNYEVKVERPDHTDVKTANFNEKMAEEKAIYFTKDHHEHNGAIYEDMAAFKATWNTKWNVFFLFTMGNAVGRLSFGITSDILAGYKILALTKSFYIMVCCGLYVIFFGWFAMIPDLAAAPMQVNILTALIGITYGGIFTMVTAYMKEVCAKNQVGMLLGFALVILAVMTYCGNNFLYIKHIRKDYDDDVKFHSWGKATEGGEHDKYKTDVPSMAGKNTLKSFCYMSIIGNVIALVVSIFMWLQHMQIKKAEIAAAEEAEFTDESDDENEADQK
jgi:FtsH-binding integral membrane protein